MKTIELHTHFSMKWALHPNYNIFLSIEHSVVYLKRVHVYLKRVHFSKSMSAH
jgi:hypothetical protein